MATKISGFDLFSLVEDLINEEKSFDTENIDSSEESKNVEKEFLEAAKEIGAYNKEGHEKREDHKGKEMSRNKDKKSPKKDNAQVKIEDDSSEEEENREEVKTSDDSPTTLKLADALDYKKFVDDLNKFRSAHSFDDVDIAKELKKFYLRLTDEEKKVFYVILKGLVHVTLMGVDGSAAETPSDVKFNIEKTGNTDKEKRDSSARKIAASSKGKEIEQMPIDTIQIGNVSDGTVIRQDKSKIYEVLRKNA